MIAGSSVRAVDVADILGERTDALFIVTTWNATHRFVDTKRQLHGLGVRNPERAIEAAETSS